MSVLLTLPRKLGNDAGAGFFKPYGGLLSPGEMLLSSELVPFVGGEDPPFFYVKS
jgi:hypothetical protein